MKTLPSFALMTGLMTGTALAETVNFDELKTGSPPPGWTATKTGKGDPRWEVVADDSAPSRPNVLRQSGQAAFPVCIKDDTRLKDGFVEVKFKPVSGKQDQAGGVIWRCAGRRQLLRRARQCARRQRHHLPHRQGPAGLVQKRESRKSPPACGTRCGWTSRATGSP